MMDGDARLIRVLLEQPGLERQVRRRAGNRCEAFLEDSWGNVLERCPKRGAAVDICLSFQGWLGDEITARDIRLLCEECYDRSDAAEEFAHFEHMLSKGD
jgi:hypothetical protein